MLTEEKYQNLLLALKKFSRVAVAFSGGVDSSLLYYAAREALGQENVVILRGVSVLISTREQDAAAAILEEFIPPHSNCFVLSLCPLDLDEVVTNTEERCYYCKQNMYTTFLAEAERQRCTVLLDGSNVDDLKSVRPGFRAIHELAVETPMLDAGLSKDEIRSLARNFGISNYNKPSNSCLATRIPEGIPLSMEKLNLVEKCESFLLDRGFTACRVKVEGLDAVLQLENAESVELLTVAFRVDLLSFAQGLGFKRVLLDLKLRF